MGSSQTRDQSGVPCIGRQILIHWTTKEVLAIFRLDWFCFCVLFCFFVFVLARQLLWNSPKMMCLSVAHSLLLLVAFHCMDFTSWWDICVVSHEFTFFFFKSVLGAEKWQEMITGSAILYFLFVEKVQWSRGCSWKTEDRGMVKNEANGASEKENPRGKLI